MKIIQPATRQLETMLRREGWVAPVGPNPTVMWLRHAGAEEVSPLLIPAIAMVDARAPWTHSATKLPVRPSRVKNAAKGNRPHTASQSSEGLPQEGGTSRRNYDSAQSAAQLPRCSRDTLTPTGKGSRNPGNRVDTAHRRAGNRLDHLRVASAGCSNPPRTQQCRKQTWKPPRALEHQNSSRTLAACARRVGDRPSKRPGQLPGYAKFGQGHQDKQAD